MKLLLAMLVSISLLGSCQFLEHNKTTHKFDAYPVNHIDHNKYAEIDFKSNTKSSQYRTVLAEAYKAEQANFSGHYSFIFFGCGTSCQMGMVIDRKTGQVYDAPIASLGYDFQVSSNLLIINPKDNNDDDLDCDYCEPQFYIFDEGSKSFIPVKDLSKSGV
jgi:hypothetical protein